MRGSKGRVLPGGVLVVLLGGARRRSGHASGQRHGYGARDDRSCGQPAGVTCGPVRTFDTATSAHGSGRPPGAWSAWSRTWVQGTGCRSGAW